MFQPLNVSFGTTPDRFPARSAPAMFAPPISTKRRERSEHQPQRRAVCRRSRRNASRTDLILRHDRFVGSNEDGGSQRTSQRAERAIRHSELGERGNQIRIARRRSEEERAEAFFPPRALTRLVGAVLAEQHDEWTELACDTSPALEFRHRPVACHFNMAKINILATFSSWPLWSPDLHTKISQ
jgi:hypothetical protein